MENSQERVTNEFLASHQAEYELFAKAARKPYGLRFRDALSIAIEQAQIEEGETKPSQAGFIEKAVIQRLGGVAGVVSLIRRNIERRNRKERAIDPINPKLWEINADFELVQSKGTDY